VRASGRNRRGLKQPSDRCRVSLLIGEGTHTHTSSALHPRLGRLVPADDIKRACKKCEPRGRGIFVIVKPLSMAVKDREATPPLLTSCFTYRSELS